MSLHGHRIYVVGATGAGKSTLARSLSDTLHLPHVELDDLYWDADWTPSPRFGDRVSQMLQDEKDGWIVDGNYRQARAMLWEHVDTVVWLDYPIWVNFYRLWCRCWKRWWYQTPLWRNGNIDSLWTHLTTGHYFQGHC